MPLVHALVFEDILALGLISDSSARVEAEWAMAAMAVCGLLVTGRSLHRVQDVFASQNGRYLHEVQFPLFCRSAAQHLDE